MPVLSHYIFEASLRLHEEIIHSRMNDAANPKNQRDHNTAFLRALAVLLCLHAISQANAETHGTPSWKAGLSDAETCILQSKPDARRAFECYDLKALACVSADGFKSCLQGRIEELVVLLPLYNKHENAVEIASQYDPARCEGLAAQAPDLPQDQVILQCRFTALMTQVTAGHIASIWGEFPLDD